VVQLLTFIAYSAIRLMKEEFESRLRIFEISFIMFVMLLGLVYCLSEVDFSFDDNNQTKNNESEDSDMMIEEESNDNQDRKNKNTRFLFPSFFLFCLWLRYEIFWVRRMLQIVEVRVR